MSFPSRDFPIEGQRSGAPCEWCGAPLDESVHEAGHLCTPAASAQLTAEVLAKELTFAAALLRREACVWGEEPLGGTLARVRDTLARLEELAGQRRKSTP